MRTWLMRQKTLHIFHATGEGFAIPLQEPAPEPELAEGRPEVALRPGLARRTVMAGSSGPEAARELDCRASFGN